MKKTFLLFCFLFPLLLHSQTGKLHAKAFVKPKEILLRWAPADKTTWELCNKYGYKIERIELNDLKIPDTSAFKNSVKLTTEPLKPLPEADSTGWKQLEEKEPNAGLVFTSVYKPLNGISKEQQQAAQTTFGLTLLSINFSKDLAKASALFFKDSTINNTKMYAYRISVYGLPKQFKIEPAILITDASEISGLPRVNDLKGNFSDRISKLNWNVSRNQEDYTAYIIERSEDSINFKPINKTPYVQMKTQFEKEKPNATYSDSLPDNKKYYYYRVSGISYFGELSKPSNVAKGKGKNIFSSYPYIDSTQVLENKKVNIFFHLHNETDKQIIKGFAIARAEKADGKYNFITKNILPASSESFIDEEPLFTNYYKVYAVNEDDSASSHEVLAQLEDRSPPLAPARLTGICDSAGIVTLSWEANKETDLKGYRIFRVNSLKEEWVEISTSILTENKFTDSININTLTPDIFYSLTAVDRVYNNSPYSAPLKIKRPDKIAPVACIFQRLDINPSGININWIASTSTDIVRYELFRKDEQSNTSIKIKEWQQKDSLVSFKDTTTEYEHRYSYLINVFDDSNNKTQTISPSLIFEPGVRKPIQTINYSIDREKKNVLLSWSYPVKNIDSYVIYKSKKGEQLRIYKTIDAANITDTELYPNNIYIYKIKAVFNSGAESILSESVEVEY